jgi:hypothetical protein
VIGVEDNPMQSSTNKQRSQIALSTVALRHALEFGSACATNFECIILAHLAFHSSSVGCIFKINTYYFFWTIVTFVLLGEQKTPFLRMFESLTIKPTK